MNFRLPDAVLWPAVLGLTLFLGWIDLETGHELNFFVFYFLPVAIAGWRMGLGAAVVTSVVSAITWAAADSFAGKTYSDSAYAVWNAIIRLCSFLCIGWSVHTTSALIRRERSAAAQLQRALAEVKALEGLLRICAQCKKIVNSEGRWQQLESYITDHSEAKFTHGYCPDCAKRLLEEAGFSAKDIE